MQAKVVVALLMAGRLQGVRDPTGGGEAAARVSRRVAVIGGGSAGVVSARSRRAAFHDRTLVAKEGCIVEAEDF